jgi:uncharacterized protein
MHSCLYFGRVSHRRHGGAADPVSNAFEYRMFMVWLDLAELDTVFRGRWFWSTQRRALAWLRAPTTSAIRRSRWTNLRARLVERTHRTPAGGPDPAADHLRYFGHCFNPVSFYYCYDAAGEQLETIVAEVSNTPWGERTATCCRATRRRVRGPTQEFELDKEFHVSPFLPMETRYQWRFTEPGERLLVHLRNEERAARLRRNAEPGAARDQRPALAGALLRFPFMTCGSCC